LGKAAFVDNMLEEEKDLQGSEEEEGRVPENIHTPQEHAKERFELEVPRGRRRTSAIKSNGARKSKKFPVTTLAKKPILISSMMTQNRLGRG